MESGAWAGGWGRLEEGEEVPGAASGGVAASSGRVRQNSQSRRPPCVNGGNCSGAEQSWRGETQGGREVPSLWWASRGAVRAEPRREQIERGQARERGRSGRAAGHGPLPSPPPSPAKRGQLWLIVRAALLLWCAPHGEGCPLHLSSPALLLTF